MKDLFLKDFSHEKTGVFHPNLVLSPDYSREKMQMLIETAQESLDLYFAYISDDVFEEKIFAAARRGVRIRFLTGEDFYEEHPEDIKKYRDLGIEIFPLEGPKLHTKSIFADEVYLYIGSINFSRHSFDENREIGLIMTDQQILSDFQRIFESDFTRSEK